MKRNKQFDLILFQNLLKVVVEFLELFLQKSRNFVSDKKEICQDQLERACSYY